MTEHIVHERKVVLAVVLAVDDRAAELFVDGAEYAIDESARGVASEGFGEFDGLIDSDFRGYLRAVGEEELVEPKPKDVAVYRRDALERPLGCGFFYDEINVVLLREDALEEIAHERLVGIVAAELSDIAREDLFSRLWRCVRGVPLEKRLENNRAR